MIVDAINRSKGHPTLKREEAKWRDVVRVERHG